MTALKLVHPAATKKERQIEGHILRRSQRAEDRSRVLKRSYSSLTNATSRLVSFMMENGYVGDVCEVYHKLTGMQLGIIRITSQGKLSIWWAWESEGK